MDMTTLSCPLIGNRSLYISGYDRIGYNCTLDELPHLEKTLKKKLCSYIRSVSFEDNLLTVRRNCPQVGSKNSKKDNAKTSLLIED